MRIYHYKTKNFIKHAFSEFIFFHDYNLRHAKWDAISVLIRPLKDNVFMNIDRYTVNQISINKH